MSYLVEIDKGLADDTGFNIGRVWVKPKIDGDIYQYYFSTRAEQVGFMQAVIKQVAEYGNRFEMRRFFRYAS